MTAGKVFKILTVILLIALPAVAMAQPLEDIAPVDLIGRGEAVAMTVEQLDLAGRNGEFLNICDSDLAACTFVFSSRSKFADINLEPLILYPDVYPAYRYYGAINLATKLDLVRGYWEEENSPFRPEQPITKIEALKLLLGASGKLQWKERFELANEVVETAELPANLAGAGAWWYSRYLLKALQCGLWPTDLNWLVDAPLTREEFASMLEKVK